MGISARMAIGSMISYWFRDHHSLLIMKGSNKHGVSNNFRPHFWGGGSKHFGPMGGGGQILFTHLLRPYLGLTIQ